MGLLQAWQTRASTLTAISSQLTVSLQPHIVRPSQGEVTALPGYMNALVLAWKPPETGEETDLVPGERPSRRAGLLQVVAAARQVYHLRQPLAPCKAGTLKCGLWETTSALRHAQPSAALSQLALSDGSLRIIWEWNCSEVWWGMLVYS